jgi:phage terminase large subunit-like protein
MQEKIARIKARVDIDIDPVAWIERNFYIPETNAPIQLEPYQRATIQEALRRDESGAFIYSLILYADIKKSAKSTIAAAVCLYLAWHTPWESVRIVANDLKQADSRTFFYIERAIRLNPTLAQLCKIKQYHITLPNNTTITAIPVDPKGEAGGGDLITCFTELWAAKNEAAKRLWSETTLSPLKFGKSLRWAESYAGFEGESPILEQLYETGVLHGELVATQTEGLELYHNDAARMLTLWNTVPRCPWQTPEYYAQEAAVLTESEFNRMHRNQWASSEDIFVPLDWWNACKRSMPEFNEQDQWVVGIDAGISSDSFGIVGVVRRGDMIFKRYAREWKPPKGGVIDFREPEAELRRLAKEYNVVCFTYDPYQLFDFCTRLRNEGVGWFKEFPQGQQRLVADKQFYDTIRERRFIHDGDAALTQHIANANAKTDGDKLRIIKRQEHLKIDLAVACSMASYTARYLNIG